MANTYLLASSTGMTAADATLFQAEQDKATIIKSIYFANVSAADVSLTVNIKNYSEDYPTYLLFSGSLPVNSTLQLLDNVLIMNDRDTMNGHASVAGAVHWTMSYMEIDD